MAEKDKVAGGKLIHAGLFNLKELYVFFRTWLQDQKYDLLEKKYSEKIKANGKEVEIQWEVSRKISDYFKFSWNITFFIVGLIKQEVQGMKLDKGEIEIRVEAFLEKDYESKWQSHPFVKFLRDVYDRYVIKSRIEDYEDRLTEEVDEAITQLKTFLSLEVRRGS